MPDLDPFTIRVTDLKQYVYCPRVLYYQTVLPDVRPTTYKMQEGLALHGETEDRERRRSLKAYGLEAGERHFNVLLFSAELALSGELDLLIQTTEELIPVDYKASARVSNHYRLQLMAYGRLLELAWQGPTKPVRRGFLFLIPTRQPIEVPFTAHLRQQLDRALAEIQAIIRAQRMPAPTSRRARCVDCEFRRFCNDVL